MCGRGLSSRGEFYNQRLFFFNFGLFFLYFCVAVLVTWWNGLPVVTYIIRPIRVSNETCRLFHQHTRPIAFLLLLIRRVTSESFSKIILGRRQNILQYAHIQNTLPGWLYTFWSFIVSAASKSTRLHLLFHAARLSDEGAGRAGGETVYNKSIYLPMLVGPVLTAVDESFYKAFCGERRWCLTSLGRMEWPRTMA